MTPHTAENDADLVTWVMPREDARDLLGWLRKNRPMGMPDRTFDGLVEALLTRVIPSSCADPSEPA